MSATTIRKRSVVIAGHRTSVSLEDIFWEQLQVLAKRQRLSVNALVESIDRERAANLSSAIRVFVLEQLLDRPAN
ncbi:ribbon-helix-helix domain-containing protein [Oceanibaculum nanhaiense]|uniref:ribbon-helix-helix domain-containing protein n=1 Tax=Oceanibaculum nanhaiense TaxID=1909734 RepID=UPI000A3B2A6C|nr:ribbon-helix-helix domain-containing protein [Oceanibaculum nanhaiense]MBC7136571.1 ribbon-helix-helix domain-containing protein [Oceanibaculum nanhaiense]MDM7947413.1 ribbon-helix-helix domain-containing protein [Oceanibaculum nanhaiense]